MLSNETGRRRPRAVRVEPILGPIVLGLFRDAPELASDVGPTTKGSAAIGRVVARTKRSRLWVRVGKPPTILRDRPWRAKANKTASDGSIVEIGSLLGLEERARRSFSHVAASSPARSRDDESRTCGMEGKTKEQLAKEIAFADYELVNKGKHYEHLRVPAEDCIWAFNSGALLREPRASWFENTGSRSSKDSRSAIGSGGSAIWDRCRPLLRGAHGSPFATERAARCARRSTSQALPRQGACLALDPERAFRGVRPRARGRSARRVGRARTRRAALLYLAHHGHAESHSRDRRAPHYGKAPAKIMDALLARDPFAIAVSAPRLRVPAPRRAPDGRAAQEWPSSARRRAPRARRNAAGDGARSSVRRARDGP